MKYLKSAKSVLTAFLLIIGIDVYSQSFTEQTGIVLPGVYNGNSAFGDADNDGDIDILITGLDAGNAYTVKLYRNNGASTFSDNGTFSPAFPSVYGSYNVHAQWVDFDNDGFLDIILNFPTASNSNNLMIYRHEADHSYLLKTTIDYWTWQGNSIDCGDYDNDGDKDILLVTHNTSRIFQNQGNFSFKEQYSIKLEGLGESSCQFVDYDNDGNLDIFIMGFPEASYSGQARLYKNNGNNSFTLQSGIYLQAFFDGSADWGDYNNDGFPDLISSGKYGNAVINRNNGNNTFSVQNQISLIDAAEGSTKFGDLDNDGDPDILISGKSNNVNTVRIYINNGNNTFSELAGLTIDGVYKSSVDLFDYDNDSDLDILISGDTGSSKITKVYKNGTVSVNPSPAAPSNLSATVSGNDIILKWNSVRNDNTHYKSMTYNLMVGTSGGAINILSPGSRTTDGMRTISGMGNARHDTSFLIRNLPRGNTYYWKVQAVDNGWKGSAFVSGPNFLYSAVIQAGSLNVPAADASTATLSWTRGNGANCAVFVKEAASGNASPVNGSSYIANPSFKSGTQIGSSGWYCVYSGSGTTVSISNLKANTDYIFQVTEFTGSGASVIYDTSTSTDNPFNFKTGNFTEIKTANLLPVTSLSYTSPSSAYWADFDNDAANGNDLDLLIRGMTATRLYRYEGANTFTQLPASFNVGYASACADYNNDGLTDIAIAGYPQVTLYRNTGGGNFAEQTGALPVTGEYGAIAWGDYNNDGFQDIIITSSSSTEGITSRLFKNNSGTSFTEQQAIVLKGVAYGSAEWADYDNDGFNDLIIAGGTSDASYITKIYRNNGNNNFIEQTGINISGTSGSTIDWGDYDNDGYLDFIITGYNLFTPITKIYRNTGTNGFTEQTSIVLPQVNNGSARWGDYDNDGDLDILLTGFTGVYKSSITKIFKNNNGSFMEDLSSILPGLGASSGTWGDYDKDGDLDIILTGNLSDASVSRIYRNDLNIVNTSPAAPLTPTSSVNKSDVTLKWKSVRNDNTPYKAITYNIKAGTTSGTINISAPNSTSTGQRRVVEKGNAGPDTTFIFKKMTFGTYFWSVQAVDNGFAGGAFSPEGSFTVSPVQAGNLSARITDINSLVLKWERGNGDRCVVFAKQTASGTATPVNNTGYVADPEFGYGSQIGSSGWYCIYNGRADSVSVTGLQYNKQYSFQIIEYMGSFGNEQYFTVTSDGNPGVFSTSLFTDQNGITLNSGVYNNVEWGDYDKDGYIDILIPGLPNTRIYRNNGDNTFTEKTGIALSGVNYGSAKWGDYDNDGDLDIIITGATNSYPVSGPLTKIYRNDGADVFTEQSAISLKPLFYSSADWGDYDNDGDLDLILNGADGTSPDYNRVSEIYDNNGNNSFTLQSQIVLEGLYRGSVKWVDYDNDGDLDIALTGAQMETQFNTEGVFRLYKNNGNKTFSLQTVTGIYREAGNSSTTWGDFDNDGDMDFIMTARGFFTVYRNMGSNTFSVHLDLSISFQGACSAAWGDYDNDGYLDFILSNPGLDTKIYRNTHGIQTPAGITAWFNRQDDDALKSIGYSFVLWGDYDNDGDLDFLMSKDSGLPTRIFKNNLAMKSGLFKTNSAPSVVSGLSYTNTPDGVYLKWKNASDLQTPPAGLYYNVRLGTSKNNFNLSPSHSSSTGYIKLPAAGNAQLDTSYLLLNMPAAKYYWSVQAVDQSFKGGPWSAVDSFEVKNVLAFFAADTVCQGLNTTFTNQSVGFGETITSYKWIFENGATSVQANPTYTFASAGIKNVTLIAYSSNTSDTLVKQVLVKGKPLTDFSSTVACLGTETEFTNVSDITGLTISSWSWDYGDGKGSTSMNPGSHGYLNSGDYDVILTATANNGCEGTITKTVTVAAFPVASISATTPLSFCSGDSVVLSVNSYSNHSYNWLSNGFSNGGITNKLTARISGSYSVEVVNLTGNCKTISPAAAVTVLNAPASPVIIASGSTICQGDSLRLEVSNTTGYRYQWKLNGGAIGSDLNSHYARNAGTYTLIVSNSFGCSVTSSNSVPVTVNPVPAVGNISHSGDTRFCNNQTIILSVPANSAYTYNWKRGTVETGNKTSSMTASQSGEYSVEAINTLGCTAVSLPITLEVVSRPAKPEIDYGSFRNDDCLGETPLKLSVKNIAQEYTYKWYLNGTPVSTGTSIETRKEGKYVLEANYDICKSDTSEMTIRLKATLPKPEIKAYGPSVWFLTTASNAFSYKWYYNGTIIPGATGNTYVAGSKTGIYMLAVADNSGCYSYSDTLRISQSVLTGIEDPGTVRKLALYPSPNKGKFTLSMENNLLGNVKISIFAQSGRKVFDREFEKTEEKFSREIEISGVSVGLYVISLYINGQFLSTGFIIEK